MPPVKKAASRRRTATRTSRRRTTTRKASTNRKPSAAKEPAALRRLNKALDEAQDALKALRKEVGSGARGIHKDVDKFVKDARREGRKLGTTIRREAEQAQKRIASAGRTGSRRRPAARGKTTGRAQAKRKSTTRGKASGRTTAKRAASGSRRTASRRTGGRRTAARRTRRG
jgi:uncharacterized protein YoxC